VKGTASGHPWITAVPGLNSSRGRPMRNRVLLSHRAWPRRLKQTPHLHTRRAPRDRVRSAELLGGGITVLRGDVWLPGHLESANV
jgi:hypothetical protein